MWALKVTRSTIAATRRGSGKTVPHSLKGRLVAMATEARSSRSVMIWKGSHPWFRALVGQLDWSADATAVIG
jgi:hypothetical protein